MDKIIGYIYETMDYDKFKRLVDNRDVTESRLGKLIASMKERYILNPIAVNENMEVIDGQGRFDARKSMGLPIHYYIAEGATIDDCRRMNKYNKPWQLLDYAISYAKSGVSSYVNLLDAIHATHLAASNVAYITGTSGAKGRVATFFQEGKYKFTKQDLENAKVRAKMAAEISDALLDGVKKNEAFYRAICIIASTDGYDHGRMLRNCKMLRGSYGQMANLANQLKEFERIYNYRAKPSGKIFFSDYMRNRGSNVRDYSTSHVAYQDADVSTLKATSSPLKVSEV